MLELNRIYNMDCIKGVQQLFDNSVHCCVTSPPYWGLRDYNVAGQIGLEGKETLEKLLDTSRMIPCCNRCNQFIETNHAWAVTRGFKLSRLKKEQ